MAKVFIALQEPTVEMTVKATDCAGNKKQILVEFKRYESEEGDAKLAEFEGITKADTDAKTAIANMRAFIKAEIVAVKQVPLKLQDEETGKVSERKIPDSRTAKDEPELWGEADNCLAFLLDMLLQSTPWSSAITTALYSVLTNTQLGKDAEAKNW